MKSRRSFLARLFAGLAFVFAVWGQAQEAHRLGPHFWPTPNAAYLLDGRMEGVLQPTVSGRLESALFGCVRNDGRRFHEGIDLKPIHRDSRNESTDAIYAFDDGVVRYVNLVSGKSGYGRYVVVEHPKIAPGFVSLYAHLRSVPDDIVAGVEVVGGQKIAVMGRSAGGYSIPRSRAHLHFELGFWLGPRFQKWFDQQPFESKNEHGSFNGMNIIGLDAWALCGALRRGEAEDVWQFVMSEQVALEAFVRDVGVPDLLKVNPDLMENDVVPADHAGWRVEMTWYGLPTRFRALSEAEMAGYERWLTVEALRPDLIDDKLCLDMTRRGYGGAGTKVSNLMKRLFVK